MNHTVCSKKPEIVKIDDTVDSQGMSPVETELSKAIIEIVKDIPEFSVRTNAQRQKNAEFSSRLVKEFRQLQDRNLSVKDKKNILNEYINAELDDLAKKTSYSFEPKIKQMLTINLLNKMLEYLDRGEDRSSSKDDSSDRSDNKSTVYFLKSLKSKLDELKPRKISEEKIKMIMFGEIKELLGNVLEQRAESSDKKVKNHFAEMLLITLLKSQDTQKTKETPKTLGDLANFLAEYSIHSPDHIRGKIIRSMKNNIRALEENDIHKGTELKDQLKIHATHEINKLLEDYSETLTSAAKETLIFNLVDEVCDIYENEKENRADEHDDLQGGTENFDNYANRRQKSVNRQVASWFRSTQYSPSNTSRQSIIERLSQNLKRIEKRDLSPKELRLQIAREVRCFLKDVAEVTRGRVDAKQKDKLNQKLMTDSNIGIPKKLGDDSSYPIPVCSKDQKPLFHKLSIQGYRNLKHSNHDKKKLSINAIEDTYKSKNKDTDSTKISEYDYNSRRIWVRKVEPKYVITGNKTISNTKQKKYIESSISTRKIKQTISKIDREVPTKKRKLAQKGSKQDAINITLDELDYESKISEEELVKLFDDCIHYKIVKKGKIESKEREIWDDVFISSQSEGEVLQYEPKLSASDYENKKRSQQNAKEKKKRLCPDNKMKKYNQTQQIATKCDKKYSRANENKSSENLQIQAFLIDKLPRRRIIRKSSKLSPAEDISRSPKTRGFEARSNEKLKLCKSKGNNFVLNG